MDTIELFPVLTTSILIECIASFHGLQVLKGVPGKVGIMFKEVVSLAIIFSFVLNFLYVPHPNSVSYTFGFVLSLAVMSPFILGLRYWMRSRAIRAAMEAHEDAVDLVFESVSDVLGGGAVEGPRADLEKGLGNTAAVEIGT
ncbi:hypothetical protein EG329_002208 [Mollisiaceae sp. DMI_Dod_QoI]|nr:hypothetical protein EG329_002208 [Helotiales sp. DMI_Dod_QoI]